jgi:hypothetical protein
MRTAVVALALGAVVAASFAWWRTLHPIAESPVEIELRRQQLMQGLIVDYRDPSAVPAPWPAASAPEGSFAGSATANRFSP